MSPLDPRTVLSNRKALDAHADLMASPQFRAHALAAFVDYSNTVLAGDLVAPATAALKLQGARGYLDRLLALGEPERPVVRTADSGLTPPEVIPTMKWDAPPTPSHAP